MDGRTGLGVEPEALRELARRWAEAADALAASRAEVAALDVGVFGPEVAAAAASFRDDLERRVRRVTDEAEARAGALRSFGGDLERHDHAIAGVLEGRG